MKLGSIKISRFTEGLTIFRPDYYLNIGKKTITDLIEKGIKWEPLYVLADKIYQGGIFKRIFNEEGDKALKYVTASDMVKSQPLDTANHISKKFTPWIEEMTLRSKQILISCAGTVGNTALVNDSYAGCIGSQEIIRVEASKIPYGYIYAYLSTPVIFEYIQSMIYGAVVPRISPLELGSLPILLPEESRQIEIHNLIVAASDLRVRANASLRRANDVFLKKVNVEVKTLKTGSVNCKRLKDDLRFSGNYFLSAGENFENQILTKEYKYLSTFVSDIFTSGRDKRNYTSKNRGVPFFSNGDLASFNPFSSCNYILRKNIKDHSLIKENMILAGRVGQDTVGKIYLPFDSLLNSAASDNIIRIALKDSKNLFMVFAFLSSKLGYEIIRKRKTGVGQPFVTENMFKNIPIPVISEDEKQYIDLNITNYQSEINSALVNELKAIELIEKQIEIWQK